MNARSIVPLVLVASLLAFGCSTSSGDGTAGLLSGSPSGGAGRGRDRGSPGGPSEEGGALLSDLFAGARHDTGKPIDLGAAGSALPSDAPGGPGLEGGGALASSLRPATGGGTGFGGLVRDKGQRRGGKGGKGRRGGRGRAGVRLGGADRMTVKGALSRAQVRKGVSRHFRQLRLCYVNRLQTRPRLQGRIVVHVVIGSNGRVKSVSSFDGIGDEALKRCVENRFRAMRFPRFVRGEVRANWPLTFRLAQ